MKFLWVLRKRNGDGGWIYLRSMTDGSTTSDILEARGFDSPEWARTLLQRSPNIVPKGAWSPYRYTGVIHLGDPDEPTACGIPNAPAPTTNDTSIVTCSRCTSTDRYKERTAS